MTAKSRGGQIGAAISFFGNSNGGWIFDGTRCDLHGGAGAALEQAGGGKDEEQIGREDREPMDASNECDRHEPEGLHRPPL